MQQWKLLLVASLTIPAVAVWVVWSSRKGAGEAAPVSQSHEGSPAARPSAPSTGDAGVPDGHEVHHDPEGVARRHPESMHGHQARWPPTCHESEHGRQSPIALSSESFFMARSSPLLAFLGPSEASLIDTGHTFQIRLTRTQDRVVFEGASYRLAQFHFHKPSEHLLDGRQAPMEAHFVFLRAGAERGAQGPRAVVLGFPVELGAEHPELRRVWEYLPPIREGYGEDLTPASAWEHALLTSELDMEDLHHAERVLRAGIALDVSRIIPRRTDFYVYEGSLTTPPCTEGITHAFASTPIYVSELQAEHFEGYYEGNNRDLQPAGAPERRAFRRAALTLGVVSR